MNGLTVVGLGEALFDVFPDRIVLGGAPLNAAVHAHQMLAAIGGRGVVASRVGNDPLGRKLTQQLSERGLTNEFIQLDRTQPTGQVHVTVENGEPTYDICSPSAWDAMQFDGRWVRLAKDCSAVCFGTLAQRSTVSREAVQRFVANASNAIRLLDVNLRESHFNRDMIQHSMQMANAVKLNSQELIQVARLLEMAIPAECSEQWCDDQCDELIREYELHFLARTRGHRGTVLYLDGERLELDPTNYPAQPDADSVGAGDACSAALLTGILLDWPAERTLHVANHIGAYVASVAGATPAIPDAIKAMVEEM